MSLSIFSIKFLTDFSPPVQYLHSLDPYRKSSYGSLHEMDIEKIVVVLGY